MEQPLGQVNFEVDPRASAKLLNGVSFVGYLVLLVTVLAMVALAVRFFGGKGAAGRRRPVGRPDARVGHDVAAQRRGLRRVARRGLVARAPARPPEARAAEGGGLMLSLPPAPSPTRPRTLLVGHRAGVRRRAHAVRRHARPVPRAAGPGRRHDGGLAAPGVEIPDVAVHMMLVTMLGGCVLAQWAVYAISQDNRRDTAIALGLVVLFGVAVLNAQVYVYNTMALDISGRPVRHARLRVTGTFVAALVGGIVFAGLMAFRELGGRYSAQGPRRHLGARPVLVLPHRGVRRGVVRHLRRRVGAA